MALTLWLLQLQPSHLRPGAGLRQVRNGPLGKRGASSRLSPAGHAGALQSSPRDFSASLQGAAAGDNLGTTGPEVPLHAQRSLPVIPALL